MSVSPQTKHKTDAQKNHFEFVMINKCRRLLSINDLRAQNPNYTEAIFI